MSGKLLKSKSIFWLIGIGVFILLMPLTLYTIAANTGQVNFAPFASTIVFAQKTINSGQLGSWQYELYQEGGVWGEAILDINLETQRPTVEHIEAFKELNREYLQQIQQHFADQPTKKVELVLIFDQPLPLDHVNQLIAKYDFQDYTIYARGIGLEGLRITFQMGFDEGVMPTDRINSTTFEEERLLGIIQISLRVQVDKLQALAQESKLLMLDVTPTFARLDFEENYPTAFQNLYERRLSWEQAYRTDRQVSSEPLRSDATLDYVNVLSEGFSYWTVEESNSFTLPPVKNLEVIENVEKNQLSVSWEYEGSTEEVAFEISCYDSQGSGDGGYIGSTQESHFLIEEPTQGCLLGVEAFNMTGQRSPATEKYQYGSPSAVEVHSDFGSRSYNKPSPVPVIVLISAIVALITVCLVGLFYKLNKQSVNA